MKSFIISTTGEREQMQWGSMRTATQFFLGGDVFYLHLQSMKTNEILETGMLRAYMDDSYLILYVSFFASGITYLHISAICIVRTYKLHCSWLYATQDSTKVTFDFICVICPLFM
jgi:hypothetical protein